LTKSKVPTVKLTPTPDAKQNFYWDTEDVFGNLDDLIQVFRFDSEVKVSFNTSDFNINNIDT
jgi:hypothetical protein